MTKEALLAFLSRQGFGTIMEVLVPGQPGQPVDRPTLICCRNKPCSLKVFPEFNYERDFGRAKDTRGTAGINMAHWNEPPKPFSLRRGVGRVLRAILGERRTARLRKLLRDWPPTSEALVNAFRHAAARSVPHIEVANLAG